MLLTIDCGNTNTVFSIWNGDGFVATWRMATEHGRTGDEYFVWLDRLMVLKGIEKEITEVVISSTVPRVVFNLCVLCERYYNCRPLVVGSPDCRLPNAPRVDPGTRIGPDRIANTAGAFSRHGGDLIVIDFGTATTFDVVDEEGSYAGGVIAPGVNLSLEALHAAAAALPHVDVARPSKVIGTNTIGCMQSGVYWGYIGLIEGIASQIRKERERPMKVIGTGGLAHLYAHDTSLFTAIEDDLTMAGLVVIHQYNRSVHV